MFDYRQVPKSEEYRDNFDDIFKSEKEKKPAKADKGEDDEDTRA